MNLYCSVIGCEHLHHAKILCRKHYDAKRRLGDYYLEKMKKKNTSRCLIGHCIEQRRTRGYCSNHYYSEYYKNYKEELQKMKMKKKDIKSREKKMSKHMDAAQDKKLVKKIVKKDCMK